MPLGAASIFGIATLVVLALIGVGLTWIGWKEESYAHAAAAADEDE